jgi:tRNA(fMet)-specific endonuclease VapC
VRRRLERALADGVVVGIPAIVLYEIWYGIKKSVRARANAAILAVFLDLDVMPIEPEDAEEAGDIRAALERAGTPIGPYDALAAAQARRRGAVLITANERGFARVAGLKIGRSQKSRVGGWSPGQGVSTSVGWCSSCA